MSFLQPRTIRITRPKPDLAVGEQPYSGLLPTNETHVLGRTPATIQMDRQGPKPGAGLPGDAIRESLWKIIFKARLGVVQTHDIITDDLGNRYQVIAPDWNPLSITCTAELLET
jgi:hypothetical protein